METIDISDDAPDETPIDQSPPPLMPMTTDPPLAIRARTNLAQYFPPIEGDKDDVPIPSEALMTALRTQFWDSSSHSNVVQTLLDEGVCHPAVCLSPPKGGCAR